MNSSPIRLGLIESQNDKPQLQFADSITEPKKKRNNAHTNLFH